MAQGNFLPNCNAGVNQTLKFWELLYRGACFIFANLGGIQVVKAQTWLEISKHCIPFKPLSSNTLHDDEMTTMVMNVNDVDDFDKNGLQINLMWIVKVMST